MPTYEYRCEANGQVLEVLHSMTETVATWGELCRIADIEPGSTPADAPVTKLMSASRVITPKIGEWKRTSPKPHRHGPGCGHDH